MEGGERDTEENEMLAGSGGCGGYRGKREHGEGLVGVNLVGSAGE